MFLKLTKNPTLSLGYAFIFATIFSIAPTCFADEPSSTGVEELDFKNDIKPILAEHCFACHGDGADEGEISFDDLFSATDESLARESWHRVLKQIRSDLMPPLDEIQPSKEQVRKIESWIIQTQLGLDHEHPNPGKLTVRRLNRVEYQNTIRDLLGVEFDASNKFPADDTGHGFDNISDVLSISPLLLEKYFDASQEIVSSVVPVQSRVISEREINGADFKVADSNEDNDNRRGQLELSYYEEATASTEFEIKTAGEYQLVLNMVAEESYVDNQFDLNSCEFTFLLDGNELLKQEFVRQGGKKLAFRYDQEFSNGNHTMEVRIKPTSEEEQIRRLRLIVRSVDLMGPLAEQHHVKPDEYDRFFPRVVPDDSIAKRKYASELLRNFAERAFRRPIDVETVSRLADLAEATYADGGETFEAGVASGMTAILASPRFIFREEFAAIGDDAEFPLIDEYSLASRLSYFLWSSMPDQELIELAEMGKLRENLDTQVKRMMGDDKFDNFIESFAGQWLQARAIETVQISSRAISRREAKPDPEADKARERFFELFRKDDRTEEEDKELEVARSAFRKRFRRGGSRINLDNDIRRSMRQETEMLLGHVIKENRSLLELVDSDYTFLNEALAKYYQIQGVKGREMRRFDLPKDSVRGGVLTQGTILATTSNPDRTSPVKRGLFVLENLLGTPTPAPPPNVPALEDLETDDDKKLSLRESLEIHRKDPQCSSCHNRMDPLGLALENFNAMGQFRSEELGQPIDSKGVLITGEAFSTISELKEILATSRKTDFYRCVTEKMTTYALGRSVEYSDIPAVDGIVEDLESNGGQASSLLSGIIHSDAFQRIGKTEHESEIRNENETGVGVKSETENETDNKTDNKVITSNN